MKQELRAIFPYGESFFSKDREFYKSYLSVFIILALQNIVTYSVNVADNIMLGSYSQDALSGAAAVNQIQFILQQVVNGGIGEALVVMAAQYWGKGDTGKIEKLIGCALTCALTVGVGLTAVAIVNPAAMAGIFTNDPTIKGQAVSYLSVMRFTYIPFIISGMLYSSLRSCQIVGIAFKLSVVSLFVNVGINYVLIFGRFGAPEMGIAGAAIGTLIARCVELICIIVYCSKKKLPIRYSLRRFFPLDTELMRRYVKIMLQCAVSGLLFSMSVACQTAVMGHLSPDAIAANSFTSTIFQYCKMIPIAASASSCVWIGKVVGKGDFSKLREYVRSLQTMHIVTGILVGTLFNLVAHSLIGFYSLTPQALAYAGQMIIVFTIISVCTSIQVPSLTGIIRGGGDTRYVLYNDLVFATMSMTLSILAAFVFHFPVWAICFIMNMDQCIKVITVATIKLHSYTWIKKMV